MIRLRGASGRNSVSATRRLAGFLAVLWLFFDVQRQSLLILPARRAVRPRSYRTMRLRRLAFGRALTPQRTKPFESAICKVYYRVPP
jgi:hypothetical protein